MKNVENVYDKLERGGFDSFDFNISINTTIDLSESNIYTHNVSFEYETPDENKIIVGEARCMYLDSYDYVTNEKINLLLFADLYEPDIGAAVYAVTDQHGVLKEDYFGSSVLYIDRFYIEPEFRGKGIGKLMFTLIINVLAKGVGVITIIPAPFEDNGYDKIDKKDERFKPVLKQMTSFIKQFNFKRISKDKSCEVWAKDTSFA